MLDFDNHAIHPSAMIRRFVIMGVSGCGKSTVGAGVAQAIGAQFIDGDDLHPAINVAKMSAGIPLNDADRQPWLMQVGAVLAAARQDTIIGCSALKRQYRDLINRSAGDRVTFLYLDGSRAVIAARMAARQGHFMPDTLLHSQFATLEVPQSNENVIAVDVDQPMQEVIAAFVAAIRS